MSIVADQIRSGTITNTQISASAAIASTKLATMTANRNFGGFEGTNAADATSGTSLTTLQQVQSLVTLSNAGLAIKLPARVGTTANIGGTYNATGGTSARGQFTGMTNTIDGKTLTNTNRVAVIHQTTPAQNGIYTVTSAGTGSNGTWDRATDFDSDADVVGSVMFFIQEGTVNENTQWTLTNDGSITVGGASGSDLIFIQLGAGATYSADGVTLDLTGSQFSVKAGGIGTTQLTADAVTNAKLADAAVQAENLASDAVTTVKILDSNVTTNKLAADAVTNAKLADNAVQQENIADAAVGTAELTTDAVTTIKITDGNVTTAKLAADAVTNAKLADDAVQTENIVANAITTAKITDANVTTNKLAADAVTNAKLADNAVQQENLADASVGTAELIDASVTAAKLASSAVTGGKISWIARTVTGTPNGVLTTFTTSAAATSLSLNVFRNGLWQVPEVDYTYATNTITFASAPLTDDVIGVTGVTA